MMQKSWEGAQSKTIVSSTKPKQPTGDLTPPTEAHINQSSRPEHFVRTCDYDAFIQQRTQNAKALDDQSGKTLSADLPAGTVEKGYSGCSSASDLATEPCDDSVSQNLRRRRDSRIQKTWPPVIPSMSHNELHISHDLQQKAYILQVCRVLMMYGAPTHRLEEYMKMTAEAIGLPLQTFYMPGCMIISFSDSHATVRASEVHLVRTTQSLNLSKLYDVHFVYKDVIHKKMNVEEATARLEEITVQKNRFSPWFRVLMYGLASMSIGPVSFEARPIDLPFIFLLGSLLGCMELVVASRSELYAHVFEISSTLLISFLARAIGSITLPHNQTFCFSAICQASLLMILPGFTITNGALELQTKNIVSGSVRMVYAIIYTLFLAFGITVGISIYGAIDSNATSSTTCSSKWPFWWQVIFVPPFTLCWVVVNNGKWAKMPGMIALTLAGWLVAHFSQQYFSKSTQIAQMLGALSVGILANLSSRLWHDLAAALLHPAIFIQVPGSLAVSGGLLSGLSSASKLTNRDMNTTSTDPAVSTKNTAMLRAGYSMVEIAIAITVGLSVSALLVYPLRKTKGASGLFTF